MKIKLEIEIDDEEALELMAVVKAFKEVLEEISYRLGNKEDKSDG
jgi:hypothetical protein